MFENLELESKVITEILLVIGISLLNFGPQSDKHLKYCRNLLCSFYFNINFDLTISGFLLDLRCFYRCKILFLGIMMLKILII